jgi:hypothetical protein
MKNRKRQYFIRKLSRTVPNFAKFKSKEIFSNTKGAKNLHKCGNNQIPKFKDIMTRTIYRIDSAYMDIKNIVLIYG